MPGSRTLRGIEAGIAESFISRNSDLGGYWGIGMLLRSAKRLKCQTIRLDLISGQLDPNLRGLAPLSASMLRERRSTRKKTIPTTPRTVPRTLADSRPAEVAVEQFRRV